MDLDDTLCDYNKAMTNAKQSVSAVLQTVGISPKQFWAKYEAGEPGLFRLFSQQLLTVADYRYRRFGDALREFGCEDRTLVQKLNEIYMDEANIKLELFPDTIPFLSQLTKANVKTAVLTNGPSDGQRDKLAALGLEKYFRGVFIGAEIGCSKPSKEAFAFVLDRFDVSPKDAIMIGDSVEHDIIGADNAGIRSILIDRTSKYPDYEGPKATSLMDVLSGDNWIIEEQGKGTPK